MEQNTCNKCGRPMQYATEPKCNYCDACMSEYCECKLGRIKEIEPTCDSTAVIPSVTVESVEGITNLANCLVHVNDINTTFYVDDKHRVMITWAGPVDIPGYDMENNPNGYRDQIVTDIEKGIAVIYDKHGKGFTFGIEQSYDITGIINNKLDEMAASGELSQIIDTYLNAGTVHGFDTVADMKASSILGDGSHAKTLGYYAKNDLGEATYKIRSKTVADAPDEMTLIAMQDNTLVAELMLSEEMNVRQFGAKGDGSNDDTANIQKALDTCATILVPDGTYMVNAITHISMNTGNKLFLNNNTTIKAITNSANNYTVIHISNAKDVEISGGTIEGDRETHTASTGEWGMCVSIVDGSDNVYIHDINLTNAWGDGLYCNTTGSVNTERVHVKDARRNGYSIISADNFISNQDVIEDTHGTNPQSGVDIEPNLDTDILNNVIFNDLTTKNNSANGFIAALRGVSGVNIKLNNLKSIGDNRGVWVQSKNTTTGQIEIVDPFIMRSTVNGIFVRQGGDSFAHRIIRPVVTEYGVNTASSVGIYVDDATSDSNYGNILIYQPTVTNPIIAAGVTSLWAIGFYYHSGTTRGNIKVIDPIDLSGRLIRGLATGDNITVTDRFEVLKKEPTGNYTINSDSLSFLILGTNYTTNRTVTFQSGNSLPIGYEFRFINSGSYKMNISFPGQYIYPLATVASKTVTLNDKGASLTVRRTAQDEWAVISQTGSITTD